MKFKNYLPIIALSCCSFTIYSMDQKESIKQQIKDIMDQRSQDFRSLREIFGSLSSAPIDTVHDINQLYQTRLAGIALKAEGLMPDLERLSYLEGDHFYGARKKIIYRMIESQNINPNVIAYDGHTPLLEAVLFRDKAFIEYLLSKGAQPDAKTREMMKRIEGLSS